MNDEIIIKNCFQYICPEKWDNLEQGDNKNIRFCGSCEKQVYKANNKKSFNNFLKEDKCIAYFSNQNDVPVFMGEPIHPILNEDIKLD